MGILGQIEGIFIIGALSAAWDRMYNSCHNVLEILSTQISVSCLLVVAPLVAIIADLLYDISNWPGKEYMTAHSVYRRVGKFFGKDPLVTVCGDYKVWRIPGWIRNSPHRFAILRNVMLFLYLVGVIAVVFTCDMDSQIDMINTATNSILENANMQLDVVGFIIIYIVGAIVIGFLITYPLSRPSLLSDKTIAFLTCIFWIWYARFGFYQVDILKEPGTFSFVGKCVGWWLITSFAVVGMYYICAFGRCPRCHRREDKRQVVGYSLGRIEDRVVDRFSRRGKYTGNSSEHRSKGWINDELYSDYSYITDEYNVDRYEIRQRKQEKLKTVRCKYCGEEWDENNGYEDLGKYKEYAGSHTVEIERPDSFKNNM